MKIKALSLFFVFTLLLSTLASCGEDLYYKFSRDLEPLTDEQIEECNAAYRDDYFGSYDEYISSKPEDMRDTLIESGGVGLAAPQVGILRRVVLVDVGEEDNEIIEFINPEMVETDGEQYGPEGCLSVPGKYGLVKRPYYAKVRAQDRNGDWFEAEGEELIARCFCHELDHLDGIVYTEKMDRYLSEDELNAEE